MKKVLMLCFLLLFLATFCIGITISASAEESGELTQSARSGQDFVCLHENVSGIFCSNCNRYIGTCGTNLFWTLDTTTGVLIISGTGEMTHFNSTTETPWHSHRSHIKTVLVKDGVTSIEQYAFAYCDNLTDITLPESIERVHSSAFWPGCNAIKQTEGGVTYAGNCVIDCDTSVTSVTLRDDIVAIASSAFYGCANLTSITIPKSVTSIGDQAFDNCSALTSVTVEGESKLRTIGRYAFYDCPLTSLTIPVNLKQIEYSAFRTIQDIYITNVTAYLSINGDLPYAGNLHILDSYGSEVTALRIYGVTSIPDSAFSNARSVTSVYISNGVTDIGKNAFSGVPLTKVFLPESVAVIGRYAFQNNNQHISFTYCGTEKQWNLVAREDNWAITNGNYYYKDPAIGYYHQYSSVGRCTVCYSNAKGDCGKNLTWELAPSTGTLTIRGTGAMNDYDIYYSGQWKEFNSSIKSIVVENGVTSIGEYAFYRCSALSSVLLPEGLISISEYAFGNCSSLKGITIPSSVTNIVGAFDWSYLNKINIKDLTAWCNMQGGMGNYSGTYLYLNDELITDLVIPDGVTQIKSNAFFKCYSLTSITIPDSVKSIGYEAFYDCTNVKSIHLGNGVTEIGYGAFRYCEVTSLIIPNSVTTIAETAFSSSNLESIKLGKGLKRVDYYAFYDCSNLKNIYYSCEVADREKISIGSCNDPFKNATWHYNTCTDITSVHIYEWVIDQANTCASDGMKHEICSVCLATRNENTVIAATGMHTYVNEVCSICGQAQKFFSLFGKVTSSASDIVPITAMLIPITDSNATYTQTLFGNDVSYVFEDIPAGIYTLRVIKSHHLVFEETVDGTEGELKKDVLLVLGNDGKQFKINCANLVLSQNINVMYHATIPEEFENPRMVFTFNGEDTVVTNYTVQTNGRYSYVFPRVNPQKIGDNICATLYATVDGIDVCVSVPVYSVRQYCINQLNKTDDSALRTLISDLLVYGEKAQIYQNYKTDALVTAGLTLTPSTYEELSSSHNKQQIIGTADPCVRYSGASLLLSNEISLQLRISTDDPTPYTFEVTINNRTDVYTAEDLEERGGYYYLTFYGIKPSAFDDEITAVVKKDGVQISQTLKYSVHTYIQKTQNTETEVLRDLLEAIYNYGKSAREYAK